MTEDLDFLKAPSKNARPIDFTAVHAMFDAANASGLKKPFFYAEEGLRLSLAPATGRNPGAIYVNQDNSYLGKIVNGKLLPSAALTPSVIEVLRNIAENPKEYAIAYGRKTGRCCICGRLLTKEESVKYGIGPVCMERYGFAYEAVEVETSVVTSTTPTTLPYANVKINYDWSPKTGWRYYDEVTGEDIANAVIFSMEDGRTALKLELKVENSNNWVIPTFFNSSSAEYFVLAFWTELLDARKQALNASEAL